MIICTPTDHTNLKLCFCFKLLLASAEWVERRLTVAVSCFMLFYYSLYSAFTGPGKFKLLKQLPVPVPAGVPLAVPVPLAVSATVALVSSSKRFQGDGKTLTLIGSVTGSGSATGRHTFTHAVQ